MRIGLLAYHLFHKLRTRRNCASNCGKKPVYVAQLKMLQTLFLQNTLKL